MSGIHSVKSKDSRRKLRRWGFAATFNKSSNSVGKNMPGVVYGDYSEAVAVADRLKATFIGENKDLEVEITPVPFETVSLETKLQFEGLNDQAGLIAKAVFILAEKYRLSLGVVDKSVQVIVNEAIDEARKYLFPRYEQAQAKVAAIEEGIASQVATAEVVVPAEPVPEVKERKRGIEAVREALEGSGADEASIIHLEEPLEAAA